MNLRTLIITLSLIFLFQNLYASDGVSSLSGKVLGSEDKSPLIGCLVKIHGLEKQTVTNENGDYSFNEVPCGDYTVEASYMGYIPQKLNVKIYKNEGETLNFELKPDAFMLEQVVVTSSKTETKRRESPSLVNVISGKTFLNVGACSLADGLDFQPGVRVENDCQNCGFTQVRINGLDGHYSQILMNSRPIFSALAGVYGLEHIPANMIERVEIMRGGGSALFGSSAIGGTINIITKDPLENSAQASHTLTSMWI